MNAFLADILRRQRAALQRFNVIQIDDVTSEPIDLAIARLHCRVDLFGSPPASDDDTWFTEVGIPAAREYCEGVIGRALAQRTMELSASAFPSNAVATPPGAVFELPFGPVASITSVKYLDQAAYDAAYDAAYTAAYDAEFMSSADVDLATAAGVAAGTVAGDAAIEVTVAPTDYELDVYAQPARLQLAYGASWPTARSQANSVKVRYVAGYTAPGASPQPYPLPKVAKAAMLLMLGHLFKNREAVNVTAQAMEVPLGVQALLDKVPNRESTGFA